MLFEYTSPRRELTPLVVIGIDCIGIINPAIIWSQPRLPLKIIFMQLQRNKKILFKTYSIKELLLLGYHIVKMFRI